MEKQSSISKITDIKKSEIFAEKTRSKYTATNHKIRANTNDTVLHIFSVFSWSKNIRFTVRNIPPPSRMEIGYKFIIASEILHIIKNFPTSLVPSEKAAASSAKIKLEKIPPAQTNISLK